MGIVAHVKTISISDPHKPGHEKFLSKNILKTIGFGDEEDLLSYPDNVFIGYRVLTEFIHYYRKFCFFDVYLDANALSQVKDKIEIKIYFDNAALTDLISPAMFFI